MNGPGPLTVVGPLTIVGLGPAGLDRVGAPAREALFEPGAAVIVRTARHPGSAELAARRSVTVCDDLYDVSASFDEVYEAIARRVIETAESGSVVYAVPGSALVGERTVRTLREWAAAENVAVVLHPGESFLDLACAAVDVDPIGDGLQVVDARSLPDPLPLHLPTMVTQVDTPLVAADVAVTLGRVLADDHPVTVLDSLGAPDGSATEVSIAALASAAVGPRTTVYVAPAAVGWHGLVATNRKLRAECPWDRKQTHHTLLSHLIEEAYETVDAVGLLPADAPAGSPDYGAYAVVEEELGDLLLQVVFHATLAAEAGAFDVDEVAEGIRRKLVRRHPHVFGEVAVDGAADVLANWEDLKNAEKGRSSLMDDVPAGLPGTARADKIQRRAAAVGFDWQEAGPVYAKVEEELAELRAAPDRERRTDELGDVLFAVINLARHLEVDPEIALARASDTFARRFRMVEDLAAGHELRALTLSELNDLWDEAKRTDAAAG